MSSITPSRVTPFLMFTWRAEEALTFYAGLFDDAAYEVIERYGPEGPGAEGSVMHARLRIGDQAFMAFDSPPVHAFDFTPSLSLFVSCASEEEIDRLVDGRGRANAADPVHDRRERGRAEGGRDRGRDLDSGWRSSSLPSSPVARPTAVVGHGQDPQFRVGDEVDDVIREPPRREPTYG